MSPREVKDGDIHESLQQVFSSHQEQLRAVVEESARFLREASITAGQLHQQTEPVASDQPPPESAEAGAGRLKPLAKGFVDQAQRRAQEMFDEIAHTTTEVRSGSQVPRMPLTTSEKPAGAAIEEPLAATALLMKQATQHLNAAMEAVIRGMTGQLAGAIDARKAGETAGASKNRNQ